MGSDSHTPKRPDEEILRLRSRVEELEAMVQATVSPVAGAVSVPVCQWQDISTCPRDGTWFAICRDDEGPESFEVGCFDPMIWSSYEPAENGLFRKVDKVITDWRGFNNFHRATHWMPLPPAPGDRTKVDAISSAVEAEVEKIAQPIMALSDECVNALTHKRQIDHDGTEVGVSHQAVDEIHAALMAFRAAIRSRSHGGGNG